MKIYFTTSVSSRKIHLPQYKKIINILKSKKHQLLSAQTAQKKVNGDKTPSQIFTREKNRIDSADCVIAEVTQASTGVGSEISYALTHKKPVLALFYKDSKNLLSPIIAGNPSQNLYLEHYNDDNLKIKITNFLNHIKKTNHKKGRLIVIDGADGSGKQTQAEILVKHLINKGKKVKYIDFPRYYSSFHGEIVGRFLAGEFGQLDQVSPYLISLAYALDRASAKQEMDDWLASGGIIVSNRYAPSSMAHQVARVEEKKQKQFIDWLDELEYRVHKIPREDIVVYLYVPYKIGLQLTKKKKKRDYTNGKSLDIAEKDIDHRIKSEKMYLKLAKLNPHWLKIDSVDKKGNLKSIENIHKKILSELKKKKIL